MILPTISASLVLVVLCQPTSCFHIDVGHLVHVGHLDHVVKDTVTKNTGKILDDVKKNVKVVVDDAEHISKGANDILRHIRPHSKSSGCQCDGGAYDCGCCVHIDISEIKLDSTICANITYLPDDYGISVSMSLDGKVIFHGTVSARNPPPLCIDIPGLKEMASLCLVFYDLDISNKTFRGCMKLEIELIHLEVVHEDLGCVSIPLKDKIIQSDLSKLKTLEIMEKHEMNITSMSSKKIKINN